MITREQVMPLLVDACPSFTEKWKEQQALFPDEPLLYLDLAEFARHLIELHANAQTQELALVFEVVERLHFEGDHFVKEATVIGLLEGIQNNVGDKGIAPEAFIIYLKPESKRWWRQLNDFWSGKIPYVGATINEA
jgi:hypothetical protein